MPRCSPGISRLLLRRWITQRNAVCPSGCGMSPRHSTNSMRCATSPSTWKGANSSRSSAAAPHCRLGAADVRIDRDRRGGRQQSTSIPTKHRARLSELRAVSAQDGRSECQFRAASSNPPHGRQAREGDRRSAGARAIARLRSTPSERALRGPAAAHRAGARDRHATRGASAR